MDIDNIKSNEQLSELTDEQAQAVAELISNNENTIIAEKTREIWDSVDADVLSVTGKTKPANVKSYNFLKDVLSETINNNNEILAQFEAAQNRVKELENNLATNTADETLKAKLADQESVISKLRQDIESKEVEKQNAIIEANAQNTELRFDNAFNEALRGLKFKPGIPEISLNATLAAAKEQIKNIGLPSFENGEITFKDEKGLTVTDPNNLQKPLTAKEKFIDIIRPILDGGKVVSGTGSKTDNGEESQSSISLLDAKSRVQADAIISEHLSKQGLAKGTVKYQEAKDKLWNENNISSLPIR